MAIRSPKVLFMVADNLCHTITSTFHCWWFGIAKQTLIPAMKLVAGCDGHGLWLWLRKLETKTKITINRTIKDDHKLNQSYTYKLGNGIRLYFYLRQSDVIRFINYNMFGLVSWHFRKHSILFYWYVWLYWDERN